jgi:RND superfamily putative drug exporter
MFAAIARFDVKFRWLIVASWVLALIAAIGLLPSLQSVNTFNSVKVLPASSHSQRANQLAEPFQGRIPGSAALNPMTAILVAYRASGPLSGADDAAISRVEQDAQPIPGVSLVRDEGTNKDGTARVALVTVNQSASKTEAVANNIVNKIRASFAKVGAPPGLRFHLTGQFAASVDATNVHSGNIAILTVIFLIVLLFAVYRALLAPVLTLIPAVLSMLIAQRLIAEAIKAGLLSAAVIDLLVVLMLGVGADYGLFLAFRFREELTRVGDPRQALVAAMTRVGKVLSYSALTVGLSLFVLLVAPFDLYRSIGPSFAIGIGVLLVAALTLIPALLAIFGRVAFWPSHPRPGQQERWLWGRVTARVVRRPALTLAGGVVLFAALTAGLTGYRTGDFTSSAPAGSDSAAGARVLAAHFPKATLGSDQLLLRFATPVWNDPAVLTRAQARLTADPAIQAVTGPLGPTHGPLTATQLAGLHTALGPAASLPQAPPAASSVPPDQYQVYRQTAQFISPDGRTVQYYAVLRAGPVGSTAAANSIPQANAALAGVARAVGAQSFGVAGQDASAFDVSSLSNTSNAVVVPIVLVLVLVLLSLLLRSLVAPWYLTLTVGLSYLASLGFAMIVFVHLGGSDGLLFVLPLIMFIFTMAVGEDYNILVMSRIREEASKRASFADALVHATGVTGGTVTSAGLVLAGTFVVLGLAGGISNAQQLGLAVAFGVIMDTFFVRTLLVPAIAMLLGRRNWWPSKLSRPPGGRPPAPAATELAGPTRSPTAGGTS